jgi:hypothetical protein
MHNVYRLVPKDRRSAALPEVNKAPSPAIQTKPAQTPYSRKQSQQIYSWFSQNMAAITVLSFSDNIPKFIMSQKKISSRHIATQQFSF